MWYEFDFCDGVIVAKHDKSRNVDIRYKSSARHISIQHVSLLVVEESSSKSAIKIEQAFTCLHLTEKICRKILQLFKPLIYKRLRN